MTKPEYYKCKNNIHSNHTNILTSVSGANADSSINSVITAHFKTIMSKYTVCYRENYQFLIAGRAMSVVGILLTCVVSFLVEMGTRNRCMLCIAAILNIIDIIAQVGVRNKLY